MMVAVVIIALLTIAVVAGKELLEAAVALAE